MRTARSVRPIKTHTKKAKKPKAKHPKTKK